MNKLLCFALSLSIITSSLTGCATASPKPQALVIGPEAYGYTLNQPLTDEEFKAVADTGEKWGFGVRVFKRDDGQGGVLQVYLDNKQRPKLIEYISHPFGTKDECEAESDAQVAEIKARILAYNKANRLPENAGRLQYLPGERYVSVGAFGCRVRQGDPRDAYRYNVQVLEQTGTETPKQGVGDKVHDAYGSAWMTVFVIVLLPFVLIGAAADAVTD